MRPRPDNVVQVELFKENDYDLAIAHSWSQYEVIKDLQIPKVIIFHVGAKTKFASHYFRLVNLEPCYLIFNSYEDQKDWGLTASRQKVIWHGLDPNEWYENTGEIEEILVISHWLKREELITQGLITQDFSDLVGGLPVKIVGGENLAGSFEELKNYYRRYAVLLVPEAKPMPRARVEAMMSCQATVSLDCYDASRFINGKNGIISNNRKLIQEFLALFLYDAKKRRSTGKAARETARKLFHIDRFLRDWQSVLNEVGLLTSFSYSTKAIPREPKMKIFISTKLPSGGGGQVTIEQSIAGLRDKGYDANSISIDSKGIVAYLNNRLIPKDKRTSITDFLYSEKPDIFIFGDVETYNEKVMTNGLPTKWFLFNCGNLQAHPQIYRNAGQVNLHEKISKIFIRDVKLARYLKELLGEERVQILIGGCNGKELREKFGRASFKPLEEGVLISTLGKGNTRNWWKNTTSSTLIAYLIFRKYLKTRYLRLCLDNNDRAFIEANKFTGLETRGDKHLGISQSEAYRIMVESQLSLELSFSEGFPRVPNEEMNFGLPVIVSPAVCHLRENRFLAEHLMIQDPTDLMEAYEKAIRLLKDKALWEEVSQASIEFSAKYNQEYQLNSLLEGLGLEK